MNLSWLSRKETQTLVEAFAKAGVKLRFVGGAVRDSLLGLPVKDVDAATPLAPEKTLALLKAAHIHVLPTGIAHGTVTAIIGAHHFEITSLRKDISTDGRHAEVAFTDDWKEDAARRDFTMNALYLSPEGELFDYFGGQADAKAGRVKFIGDPKKRIAEDYLRILRFFRFTAHYGKTAPDAEALHACKDAAAHIDALSGERISQEMLKLLAAPHAYPVLKIMQENNILEHALDFSLFDISLFERLEAIDKNYALLLTPEVKFAGFIFCAAEALDPLAQRLKLSGATVKQLHTLISHANAIAPHATPAQQKQLLRKLGTEDFEALVALSWAAQEKTISEDHPYRAMLQLADSWEIPQFPVGGDDLIALGIKPGKELGELLKKLEQLWEDSDYTLTKEQLLAIVHK